MLNCPVAAVGIVKSSNKHKTLLFGNPSPKRYYAKEMNLCQAVSLNGRGIQLSMFAPKSMSASLGFAAKYRNA